MVRNALPADAAELQALRPYLADGRIVAQRLEEQHQGRAEFLVVEDHGRLVSFVFLKYYGKTTHPDYPDIEDLYTVERERGHGHATALLQACELRAAQRGHGQIGLAASPDRANVARRLYEKLDYRHDGGPAYVDGVYDGVEDWAIDLEKNLGEPGQTPPE